MHYQGLRDYLKLEENLEKTNQQILDELNGEVIDLKTEPVFINARTIYFIFSPVEAGEAVLQKLEAVAESNAIIKRVLEWMNPNQQGIDITTTNARLAIDGLVAAEVLTANEGNIIKALGEIKRKLGVKLGLFSEEEELTLNIIEECR